MVDRGILDAAGEHAERLLDRLAARTRWRLSDTLAGVAIAGALPFVEIRLAEIGHGAHLLGFLVVTTGAGLWLGPGYGAIILAAGSLGCVIAAIHTSAVADLPALVPQLVLYVLAGSSFLTVVQGAIRLRRRHAAPPPIRPQNDGPLQQLTAREVGILRLAASGLDVAEVAEQLFLSPNTVKTHLSHAYQKLGARNRQDAIRAAIHCGCLQFSDVCPHRSPATPSNPTIE